MEEIRLEQSKTENIIINLDSGDIIPNNKSIKQKKKESNIYNMVINYSSYSIEDFLTSMSRNMGGDKF